MKRALVLMILAGALFYSCQQSAKNENEGETTTDAEAVETPAASETVPADSTVVTDSVEVQSDSIQ